MVSKNVFDSISETHEKPQPSSLTPHPAVATETNQEEPTSPLKTIFTQDKKKRNEPFHSLVEQFFLDNKIVIDQEKIIKKNTCHEYILYIPSLVGIVQFYCHASNKKRISENDLSILHVQASYHKLPGLLITTGELTKKAEGMISKELKGLIVKVL